MEPPQHTEHFAVEPPRHDVAVLIPCLNEESTVADVVRRFRAALPDAAVYVCDNGSSDRTARRAREAGAAVIEEPRCGKGRAVRRLFGEVEADVYLLVDGDATYPPEAARRLLLPVLAGQANMCVGSRWQSPGGSRGKALNRWGNRIICRLTNLVLGAALTDVLSGYRAFSREFVKGARVSSVGFEVEVELTVTAVSRGGRIMEVPIAAAPRPEGSNSKIRLVKDGLLIVGKLLSLSCARKLSQH